MQIQCKTNYIYSIRVLLKQQTYSQFAFKIAIAIAIAIASGFDEMDFLDPHQ